VKTVARFLIPCILLSSSDGEPINNDDQHIDAMKYLHEYSLILTETHTDNIVDEVLCNLYGYVVVLEDDGDPTVKCENASKLLQRCGWTVEIEKARAMCCSLVLRRILLLHRKGISIVGRGHMELSSTPYIERMKKYVSKQLGSSLTESIIIAKYWLSSSQTSRQREESWNTMSFLCVILIDFIENGTVKSGELGISLHSFIAIILDPTNMGICSPVLSSLNAVLSALFSTAANEYLVLDNIAALQKLSLALIQTHQKAYKKLYLTCDSSE
jgi:hypothetical protein